MERGGGGGRKYIRVDPMEKNSMRTKTVDGNTHMQKAKLTTSKQAPSLLFLQRSVPPCHSKFVLNILNFLKLYHCCSLNKFVIYFPELSISILIVIIQLSSKLAHATSISTITSQKIYIPASISQYFLNIYWSELEVPYISYLNKKVSNIWLW